MAERLRRPGLSYVVLQCRLGQEWGAFAAWGPKDVPHGLKPNIDLIGFIGPTEVVPLLQSLCSGDAREFFRKL
jgi:hypothetical protein